MVLETTETGLVRNVEQAIGVLSAIRELGVGIAIDDFDTGYSSLSQVECLLVDLLKVDREFAGPPHDQQTVAHGDGDRELRYTWRRSPRASRRWRSSRGCARSALLPARPGIPLLAAGAGNGDRRASGLAGRVCERRACKQRLDYFRFACYKVRRREANRRDREQHVRQARCDRPCPLLLSLAI
jgi:EAL domain